MPDLAAGAVVAPAAASDQEPGSSHGPAYRPCVLCGALMNRRNYGRKSGVIVDVCSRHGLWFDLHEIDRLLRWIREGGEDRTKHLQAEEDRTIERQKRLAAEPDKIELDHQMTALVGIQRGSFLTDLMSGDILRAMMRLFE
jgi:Zn-finger nucleic acid-binding protein